MTALHDTDAWRLFPPLAPPAQEKVPTEEVKPEVNWFGRFLSLFDPGAIILILAWIFFFWIIFK